MSGAQGTVHDIVYESPEGPNDVLPSRRRPLVLGCCFPIFAGPPFYGADPERRSLVSIRAITRRHEERKDVLRIQFPRVLGWALTPWRAQGMALDCVVVSITKFASRPGVAFVAPSRVRHPDDLLLDDNFPDMATIMKQCESQSFQNRVHWKK